ncbi:XrtN system VIT domain-containing protein [Nafulsella turpanensis]|uniref:XrtN system VIT domain-containing protein n=1 Tax=Nafulsella turpanensis TaxID=1265690 RepID=UPI00034AAFF0|nr:XrtN system VIT domain-containing protein [Nafulsella turpanensis]
MNITTSSKEVSHRPKKSYLSALKRKLLIKPILENLQQDRPLTVGLLMLLISALLYSFTYPLHISSGDVFSHLFFIHYGIAIIYLLYLMFTRELRLLRLFRGKSKPYHILLLLQFNISAYALNQTLPVFQESVSWLSIFLVMENLLLAYCLITPSIPKRTASFLLFFVAFALVFNLYQSLLIFPYVVIGLLASPFLGISLHALVPLAFVAVLVVLIRDLLRQQGSWMVLVSGSACCFMLMGYYVYQWDKLNQKVSQVQHQQHIPGTSAELPDWVRLAQALPDDWFTEMALKSGLVYQESRENDSWFDQGFRFEGKKLHDPLLTIAGMFQGKLALDRESRIKILDARYNLRHETADRFWSGLNLKTSDVITNVQLFPAYRLAYTEIILRIRNESQDQNSGWFSQEEALYTFQLPEGGAVSSLSLWIEGQEAKARLTTKGKAEQAYNTIVGREARDPSVVYWMEGNKIRVRVFPCTPREDRQFKIGISSPLRLENGQLSYNSIFFKGPAYEGARGSVNLLIEGTNKVLNSSLELSSNGNSFAWSGMYIPQWTITTPAVALAKKPFFYQGSSYSVQELEAGYTPFHPEHIYLDLHNGWSSDEIDEIAAIFPGKPFRIHHFLSGRMEHMEPEEIKRLLAEGQLPQFTLFPFHKMEQAGRSLLITKGNKATPNLSDIEGAAFSENLFSHISKAELIRVFDLNDTPNDYIRSLKEFQVLQYASGSFSLLKEFYENKRFPLVYRQEEAVALAPAGMLIARSSGTDTTISQTEARAPDHLLRLFSYNQVLRSIGRNYFNKAFINDEMIKEASLGNVVTPVSSLIVLESLKDYKRFGIEEDKSSLGNAVIDSSGAVPEPHEWALILLGLVFISWLWIKKPFSL